jgi:hypothetical protein
VYKSSPVEASCLHVTIPSELQSWLVSKLALPKIEHLYELETRFPERIDQDLINQGASTNYRSLEDCRRFLAKMGSSLRRRMEEERWVFPVFSLERWHFADDNGKQLLDCIRFLRAAQRDNAFRPDATPLLRDALFLYCGDKVDSSVPDYGLWFLFLQRFWDDNSSVPNNPFDRGAVCKALLASHDLPQSWDHELPLRLPRECLHAHLAVLLSVAPGAMIEELDNIVEDVADPYDCEDKTREDKLWTNLKGATPDIQRYLPRLILEAFGTFGPEARRYILERTEMFEEAMSSISRIAREVNRAAVSTLIIEKHIHLGRALAEIAELRREGFFRPRRFFLPFPLDITETDIAGADVSVQTAIDTVEEIVSSARAALPLSPLAVVDVASRKESFYFAFLIDHENFFAALYDYIISKFADLSAYRDRIFGMKMFDYKVSQQWKPDGSKRDKKTPTYIVNRGAYGEEHRILMKYVLQQLQHGWEKHVGVQDLNYYRAYAYWGRHFPHAHDEVYGEFRIKPDRPRGAPHPGSQAVDQEIFAEIAQIAASQKRIPFFVVVSGDAGYLPVLDRLREVRGAQYQYWFFEHQRKKTQLEHLRGTWVRLEDVLQLDKLDVSKLEAVPTENSVRINPHSYGTLIADLVDALSLLASIRV